MLSLSKIEFLEQSRLKNNEMSTFITNGHKRTNVISSKYYREDEKRPECV